MKILVACEESQEVCKAFRAKNHEAYSCDVIFCSGKKPEWHIWADVKPLLNGNCQFRTCDGELHFVEKMGYEYLFSALHVFDESRIG